jgi:hypothetical protein
MVALRAAEVAYGARPALAWLRVGEPPPDPLNEAELSWIWAGQRFPAAALATPDGLPVEVLHPGRLNAGPGPDFRDAVLRIAGEERRGDVELHVRASAFRAHGHDQDPAYDGLALHVVYLADEGRETALSDGSRVAVAAFAPWLERRQADLLRWLAAPALWQEPCRSAEARLGGEAISETLQEAGKKRFAAKVAVMTAAKEARGEAAALWRALVEALGVGGDREGFRRLAEAFPAALARRLWRDGSLAALEDGLLAVAGLMAPGGEPGLLPEPIKPALARTGRPLNRPERRLRALAALYGLAEGDLVAYVTETVGKADKAAELVDAWGVPDKRRGPALLGRERAQELVLNVVLPFAMTRPELQAAVEALLAQLRPLAPYGKTAFLEANLRHPDGKRRVGSALEQQGLLAFLNDWCSRGGCGKCPLS